MKNARNCSYRPGLRTGFLFGLVTLTLTLVFGCATMTQEEEGELIGGVLGGVIGSQIGDGDGRTVAIIAGTITGSVIGGHIGRTMDDSDRIKTTQALTRSADGQPTAWSNADTGNHYSVTPTRSLVRAGSTCREFRLNAETETASDRHLYGLACKQSDGSWRLQSDTYR